MTTTLTALTLAGAVGLATPFLPGADNGTTNATPGASGAATAQPATARALHVAQEDDEPATSGADGAPDAGAIDKAIGEAVTFLLGSQENYVPDPPVGRVRGGAKGLARWQEKEMERLAKLRGVEDAAEWPYEGVYRVRPDGRIPAGYRVGGTSIACEALLRSGTDLEPMKPALGRALAFVLDRLENDSDLAGVEQTTYDVRGWGHSYGLQFLMLALEHDLAPDEETKKVIEATIPDLIARLEVAQTKQGGWNYAGGTSVSPFMTGATLLHLYEAVERGYDVPAEMIEEALDGLEDGRTEEVSYAYAGRARGPVAMPGSSARSACAELALYKAGRSDVDSLRMAIDGFFEGWEDLLVRKSQQGTHVGEYGIAPYYFFFGHTYAALAIEELPEKERAAKRAELARLLWETRDGDGTWNDRIFPRTASYSTAMTILALRAPVLPPIPGWQPDAAPAKKK